MAPKSTFVLSESPFWPKLPLSSVSFGAQRFMVSNGSLKSFWENLTLLIMTHCHVNFHQDKQGILLGATLDRMNSAIADLAKEKAAKAIGGAAGGGLGGGAGGSPEDAMIEAEKLKGQNRLEEGMKALQGQIAGLAAKVGGGGGAAGGAGGGAAGGGGATGGGAAGGGAAGGGAAGGGAAGGAAGGGNVGGGGGGGGDGGGGAGGAMAPAMAASQQKIADQIGNLGETVGKLAGEVQAMKDNSKMWAAAGGGGPAGGGGGAPSGGGGAAGGGGAPSGGGGGGSAVTDALVGQMAGNALGSALKAAAGVSQATQMLNAANMAGAGGLGGGGGGMAGGGIAGILPGGALANAGAGLGGGLGLGGGGGLGLGGGGLGLGGGAGGGAGGGGGGGGGGLAAALGLGGAGAGSSLTGGGGGSSSSDSSENSQQKALSNILGIASKRERTKGESSEKTSTQSKDANLEKENARKENPVQRDKLSSAPNIEKLDPLVTGWLFPIVKRHKISVLVPRGRNRATFNYTSGNKFMPKEDTGKQRPKPGDKAVKQAQENGVLGAMPGAFPPASKLF